jgi:hypothetical protein
MEALEVHHKHPTAYGGPDTPDNKCLLCASCHSAVHRVALKMYSRQTGVAKDIVVRYLPDQPQRQERMLKLAEVILQARILHTRSTEIPEAGLRDNNQDTVKMSLDVPAWLHHRLKTLAIGTGLYKYVLTVLANHAAVMTNKPGASKEELYGAAPLNCSPPDDASFEVDFTKT